jgi:hypothetical protein
MNLIHGDCANNGVSKIYNVWRKMRQRCERTYSNKYKSHGARGIAVCPEWHDYLVFKEWALDNGYQAGLQLDRINNDGNYEPSNCRFVTCAENNRNRRDTINLTINDQTMCLAEWARRIKKRYSTVDTWYLKNGREFAQQKIASLL